MPGQPPGPGRPAPRQPWVRRPAPGGPGPPGLCPGPARPRPRTGHWPGGVPWPSPWHPPAVSGNYAAWAQGYGAGGEVEIRLANLATGQVKVIRTGHTQPPFFDRNLLVWPESDRPGEQTTLHAVSVT